MASVTKDFHRLLKRVGKVTDGQATILDIDWDEGTLQSFHVLIQPNCGLYKNGKFKFEFKIPEDYPDMPPIVWCHTDIYHPNIDPTEEIYDNPSTNVCLNILESGVWSRSFGLEGAILGLLFLMHNPNLEDPLSPYFEGQDDQESFEENVKKYMAGENIDDDVSFEKDFCVIEGILVADQNIVSEETNKDKIGNLVDGIIDKLNIANDIIVDTENKSTNISEKSEDASMTNDVNDTANGASNEPQCSSSQKDEHFTKEEEVGMVNKDADGVSKPIADNEKSTHDLDNSASDENYLNEESNDCDIELVNIDGDCVLLIHRSMSYDSDLSQEISNTVETVTDDVLEVTNTTAESNNNSQESTEVKTETNIDDTCGVTTGLNNLLNTEGTARVDSSLDVTQSDVETERMYTAEATQKEGNEFNNTLPSFESENNLNEKETERTNRGESLSDGVNCGCGALYTIRYAFSKIVHTIGHNKLYRDIGI